ncbi:MAG: septum formation protein Maf [bacterium]|nr:septum formation protein Maf [bacterium]
MKKEQIEKNIESPLSPKTVTQGTGIKFILASSSPRRKELLNLLSLQPQIVVPEVDESRLPDEAVADFLRRVTIAKGKSVLCQEYFNDPIISSDTIVLCDGVIIGKPKDRHEAFDILKTLSDSFHQVLTGVAIHYRGKSHYEFATTRVEFAPLSDAEINYYLDNENYMDKAGAYAIQGKASVFVKKIDGCYFNVMGFPLNLFYEMLKALDIKIFSQPPSGRA